MGRKWEGGGKEAGRERPMFPGILSSVGEQMCSSLSVCADSAHVQSAESSMRAFVFQFITYCFNAFQGWEESQEFFFKKLGQQSGLTVLMCRRSPQRGDGSGQIQANSFAPVTCFWSTACLVLNSRTSLFPWSSSGIQPQGEWQE